MSWLKADVLDRLGLAWQADGPPPRAGYGASILAFCDSPTVESVRATTQALSTASGTSWVHPFLDPTVIAALARWGGRAGPGPRTQIMRALAADLLPDPVLDRSTKAEFRDVVWTEETLQLMSTELVDVVLDDPVLAALVDADQLSREWSSPMPSFMSGLLAQAAWLSQGSRSTRRSTDSASDGRC